jgi:hypothetical protein
MTLFPVDECPLCKKRHKYPVEIVSHDLFSADVMGLAVTRTFTLVLTCPVKNAQFQAKIQLIETPNHKIVSVTPTDPLDE